MIPTTLPPTGLPKAHFLTDALSGPCQPPVDPKTIPALRNEVVSDLCRMTCIGHPDPVRRRIRPYDLRLAAGLPEETPFSWTPRTARRVIGIMAVKACLGSGARHPADGVRMVMSEMASGVAAGSAGRSLSRWVGCLGRAARSAVAAEATDWATNLWCALDWPAIRCSFTVGEPDRWWAPPRPAGVVLVGRADVRVTFRPPRPAAPAGSGNEAPDRSGGAPAAALDSSDGFGGESTLTVMGGHPTPTAKVELGLTALVDALNLSPAGPPRRVIGWWPACGRALVLTVDGALLRQTARAVVSAAGRLVAPWPTYGTGYPTNSAECPAYQAA